MAVRAGEVDVVLRARRETLQRDLRGGVGDVRRFSGDAASAFSRFGATIITVNQGLQLLRTSLGGLSRFASSFTSASGQVESLRTRLTSLLGDETKAIEQYKVLARIAETTPFSLRGVVEAGVTIRAFGDRNRDAAKSVADLAAFMGTDVVEAAQAYGRAFAAGAGAADILRERGVLNIIRDQVQKVRPEIDDLTKLSLPTFRRVLQATMVDPTAGIVGSTNRLAATWEGALSNMEDATFNLRASLGGLVTESDVVDKGIRDVTDIISGAAVGVNAWTAANRDLIDTALASFVEGTTSAVSAFASALPAIITGAGNLATNLGRAATGAAELAPSISSIGAAFDGVAAKWTSLPPELRQMLLAAAAGRVLLGSTGAGVGAALGYEAIGGTEGVVGGAIAGGLASAVAIRAAKLLALRSAVGFVLGGLGVGGGAAASAAGAAQVGAAGTAATAATAVAGSSLVPIIGAAGLIVGFAAVPLAVAGAKPAVNRFREAEDFFAARRAAVPQADIERAIATVAPVGDLADPRLRRARLAVQTRGDAADEFIASIDPNVLALGPPIPPDVLAARRGAAPPPAPGESLEDILKGDIFGKGDTAAEDAAKRELAIIEAIINARRAELDLADDKDESLEQQQSRLAVIHDQERRRVEQFADSATREYELQELLAVQESQRIDLVDRFTDKQVKAFDIAEEAQLRFLDVQREINATIDEGSGAWRRLGESAQTALNDAVTGIALGTGKLGDLLTRSSRGFLGDLIQQGAGGLGDVASRLFTGGTAATGAAAQARLAALGPTGEAGTTLSSAQIAAIRGEGGALAGTEGGATAGTVSAVAGAATFGALLAIQGAFEAARQFNAARKKFGASVNDLQEATVQGFAEGVGLPVIGQLHNLGQDIHPAVGEILLPGQNILELAGVFEPPSASSQTRKLISQLFKELGISGKGVNIRPFNASAEADFARQVFLGTRDEEQLRQIGALRGVPFISPEAQLAADSGPTKAVGFDRAQIGTLIGFTGAIGALGLIDPSKKSTRRAIGDALGADIRGPLFANTPEIEALRDQADLTSFLLLQGPGKKARKPDLFEERATEGLLSQLSALGIAGEDAEKILLQFSTSAGESFDEVTNKLISLRAESKLTNERFLELLTQSAKGFIDLPGAIDVATVSLLAFTDDGLISIERFKRGLEDAAQFIGTAIPSAIDAALDSDSLFDALSTLGSGLGETLLNSFKRELTEGALLGPLFTEITGTFGEAGALLGAGDKEGFRNKFAEGLVELEELKTIFAEDIGPLLPDLNSALETLTPTFRSGGVIGPDNPINLAALFPNGITVQSNINLTNVTELDGVKVAENQRQVVQQQRVGFTTPTYAGA